MRVREREGERERGRERERDRERQRQRVSERKGARKGQPSVAINSYRTKLTIIPFLTTIMFTVHIGCICIKTASQHADSQDGKCQSKELAELFRDLAPPLTHLGVLHLSRTKQLDT